ncbi:MAG: hypothetical protein AB8B81_05710 [Halioglobus sp.]
MHKILLVGSGQLGSRHLQALKLTNSPLDICVLDPNTEALELSKIRFSEVETSVDHKTTFCTSPDVIEHTDFFLVIVASNSDKRFFLLEQMCERFNIENVLLEKLLFDTESQYPKALEMLSRKRINCWVNCCMRMQSVYHRLRDEFEGEIVHYRVNGSDYGLVTNAIHYLDHACFLDASTDFQIEVNGLSREIAQSKRPGFYELNGDLKGSFRSGSTFSFRCDETGDAPVLIEIFSSLKRYIFKENENTYLYSSQENNWIWAEEELDFKYQSQLTNILVDSLINKLNVRLPAFSESMDIHVKLLGSLNKFLSNNNVNSRVDYPFT